MTVTLCFHISPQSQWVWPEADDAASWYVSIYNVISLSEAGKNRQEPQSNSWYGGWLLDKQTLQTFSLETNKL